MFENFDWTLVVCAALGGICCNAFMDKRKKEAGIWLIVAIVFIVVSNLLGW